MGEARRRRLAAEAAGHDPIDEKIVFGLRPAKNAASVPGLFLLLPEPAYAVMRHQSRSQQLDLTKAGVPIQVLMGAPSTRAEGLSWLNRGFGGNISVRESPAETLRKADWPLFANGRTNTGVYFIAILIQDAAWEAMYRWEPRRAQSWELSRRSPPYYAPLDIYLIATERHADGRAILDKLMEGRTFRDLSAYDLSIEGRETRH